ncbi:uncharacterized protein LOC114399036 [Glycine soja]|nr:uncharacterized protein LOC114399036 [Glycine soja]
MTPNKLYFHLSPDLTTVFFHLTPELTMSVESKPTELRLLELGVISWTKWGRAPGQYESHTEAQETYFLLKGRVKFIPKDSTYDPIEFGAGDLVTIPKGLTCTWDISVAVDAHYKFQP